MAQQTQPYKTRDLPPKAVRKIQGHGRRPGVASVTVVTRIAGRKSSRQHREGVGRTGGSRDGTAEPAKYIRTATTKYRIRSVLNDAQAKRRKTINPRVAKNVS